MNKTGPKGGINRDGSYWYASAFHRPSITEPGKVLADLFDPSGNFYRTAVVADCHNEAGALRYCKERKAAETT